MLQGVTTVVRHGKMSRTVLDILLIELLHENLVFGRLVYRAEGFAKV